MTDSYFHWGVLHKVRYIESFDIGYFGSNEKSIREVRISEVGGPFLRYLCGLSSQEKVIFPVYNTQVRKPGQSYLFRSENLRDEFYVSPPRRNSIDIVQSISPGDRESEKPASIRIFSTAVLLSTKSGSSINVWTSF